MGGVADNVIVCKEVWQSTWYVERCITIHVAAAE